MIVLTCRRLPGLRPPKLVKLAKDLKPFVIRCCLHRFFRPDLLLDRSCSPEEASFLYNEIFEQQVYLQHGIAAALTNGAIVFDVGANVGLFDIFLARSVTQALIRLVLTLRCAFSQTSAAVSRDCV